MAEAELFDKEDLFEKDLEEAEVPITRKGRTLTVRVRALTRDEAFKIAGKEMPRKRAEQIVLAMAMVNPVMTEEDIARWQRTSAAGELQKVAEKVHAISGLAEDAAKSDVQGDGDED